MGEDKANERDDLELLGPADVRGLSWDWAKPHHEHDPDLTTFYLAVILVSFLIVAVFCVNVLYKRRKLTGKKRIRVISRTNRLSSYPSKAGGV